MVESIQNWRNLSKNYLFSNKKPFLWHFNQIAHFSPTLHVRHTCSFTAPLHSKQLCNPVTYLSSCLPADVTVSWLSFPSLNSHRLRLNFFHVVQCSSLRLRLKEEKNDIPCLTVGYYKFLTVWKVFFPSARPESMQRGDITDR